MYYESFWNYLHQDFGFTDDEIFDAFHSLCLEMGLPLHHELVIGSSNPPVELRNPEPLRYP